MSLFSGSPLAVTEAVLRVYLDQLEQEHAKNSLSHMQKKAVDRVLHDRKWRCKTELEASEHYVLKYRSEATDIVEALLSEARKNGGEDTGLEEREIINLLYEPVMFESVRTKSVAEGERVEMFERLLTMAMVRLLASELGSDAIIRSSEKNVKVYASCFKRAAVALFKAAVVAERQDLLLRLAQTIVVSALWAEHVLILESGPSLWSEMDIAKIFLTSLLNEVELQEAK